MLSKGFCTMVSIGFPYHVVKRFSVLCYQKDFCTMLSKGLMYHVVKRFSVPSYQKALCTMLSKGFLYHVVKRLSVPCYQKAFCTMLSKGFLYHGVKSCDCVVERERALIILKEDTFVNILGKGETSIFSFSHNVLYLIRKYLHHSSHIKIVAYKRFEYGKNFCCRVNS